MILIRCIPWWIPALFYDEFASSASYLGRQDRACMASPQDSVFHDKFYPADLWCFVGFLLTDHIFILTIKDIIPQYMKFV